MLQGRPLKNDGENENDSNPNDNDSNPTKITLEDGVCRSYCTYTPVTIVLDKFMSGGVSSRMHVLHVLPPDPPRLLTHGLSHSWTVPQVEEAGV